MYEALPAAGDHPTAELSQIGAMVADRSTGRTFEEFKWNSLPFNFNLADKTTVDKIII